MTADGLVDAGIAGVVNASPSISGRYPNLGPEVLVANHITLIDNAGPEVFKKIGTARRSGCTTAPCTPGTVGWCTVWSAATRRSPT